MEIRDPGIRCRRPWSGDAISYQWSFQCLPFSNHRAVACRGDFDVAAAGFPGLFPETVEHVDRLFKLGDVHHPEPPIGAVDTNLVGAWSNLGKGSPVIGDFAPLQLSQFVARLLPCRFGKRAQVVERRSSPVDRLVHLASMYQILYRGASVRLTSFCSHERASKVDQNKREKIVSREVVPTATDGR